MPNSINLVSKKTVINRLKQYGLSLVSLVLLGAVYLGVSKMSDRWHLYSEKRELTELAENGKYDEVLAGIEKLRGRKSISSEDIEGERKEIYNTLRLDAGKRLGRIILKQDYSAARDFIGKTKKNGIFAGQMEKFEAMADSIHPTNLVCRAENECKPGQEREKINLYISAQKGFESLKDESSRNKVDGKIISAYLNLISSGYSNNAPEANLARIQESLNFIKTAKSKNIPREKVDEFFEKSLEYTTQGVSRGEISKESLEKYIQVFRDLSKEFTGRENSELVKSIASAYIDQVKSTLMKCQEISHTDSKTNAPNSMTISQLEKLLGGELSINNEYHLGKEAEIAEDYLLAFNHSKNIVDSRVFLIHAWAMYLSLPQEKQKLLSSNIADARRLFIEKLDKHLEAEAASESTNAIYSSQVITAKVQNAEAEEPEIKPELKIVIQENTPKPMTDEAIKGRIRQAMRWGLESKDTENEVKYYMKARKLYSQLEKPDEAVLSEMKGYYRELFLSKAKDSN